MNDGSITFKIKRLKYGLQAKREPTGDAEEASVYKLSFAQWEALMKATPLEQRYPHDSLSTNVRGRGAYPDHVLQNTLVIPYFSLTRNQRHNLNNTGLTHDIRVETNPGMQSYSWVGSALSDVGVELMAVLPPLPEVRPVSPEVARRRSTVTDAQRKILQDIVSNKSIRAYLLDDVKKETICGGWSYFGKGHWPLTTAVIEKFLDMELVEIGVDIENLAMTVRVTVHGAIHAAAD